MCRLRAAQSSADRIGETRSGLSPRAAALMSGMHWKSEKTVRYTSFACLEGVDAYPNSVGAQPVTNTGGALAAPLLALTKLIRKRHNILCNCCFSVRLNSDSFGERS